MSSTRTTRRVEAWYSCNIWMRRFLSCGLFRRSDQFFTASIEDYSCQGFLMAFSTPSRGLASLLLGSCILAKTKKRLSGDLAAKAPNHEMQITAPRVTSPALLRTHEPRRAPL